MGSMTKIYIFFRRNNIVREMAIKIAEVQNAGLGEVRLRELNDEINKLLREKAKWEEQIVSVSISRCR